MDRGLALVGAVLVFVAVREYWYARFVRPREHATHHTPPWWLTAWFWLKSLVIAEPETEREPETDVETHDWGGISREGGTSKTVIFRQRRRRAVRIPAVLPQPKRVDDQLAEWVWQSIEAGASYGDIVARGRQAFGVSRATMGRRIKAAREAGAGAGAGSDDPA